jgi:hypothetical protein
MAKPKKTRSVFIPTPDEIRRRIAELEREIDMLNRVIAAIEAINAPKAQEKINA